MADNFDKFRPDWTVGTLTLTGGSTSFTATNAELVLAAIREGDAIITPSGFFLPIETLAEDGLTGTLSNPAPAAAAGTFDTRIRYQSDNSRFTGALLALTRQLTGGNLQSFGNLQGLQDLMPIFLGPGSVGLINKSEIGLQDPTGSLASLAALTLVENKAVTTDSSGNAQQIDLGTLGRELLALASGTSAEYVRADGTKQTLNKSAVGLGNVDNTSDANKPVSTAQAASISTRFSKAGGELSGGVNIASNGDSAVRFFNISSYGYTVYFNSGNGTTDNGLQVVHSSGGLIATFLYNRNFSVVGSITAGSKSFKIDHPKDPYNKDLVFMSTEAPKAGVEFWGTVKLVDGQAEVDIDQASNLTPGTFSALTTNAIVVSVNNLDEPTYVHGGRIVDGKFKLQADGNINCEVSWHVKAERCDSFIKSHPHCDPQTGLLIPEHEKEDA